MRNFNVSAWTDGQLLAAPVDAPNTVVAYDTQSGEGRTVATFEHAVKALIAAPGGWGIAGLEIPGESYNRQAVFIRTDDSVQIDLGFKTSSLSGISISPNGRSFVTHSREGITVWNSTTGASTRYVLELFTNFTFVDNVTLQSAYDGATFNVETGVYTPAEQQAANPVRAAVAGQDGAHPPFSGGSMVTGMRLRRERGSQRRIAELRPCTAGAAVEQRRHTASACAEPESGGLFCLVAGLPRSVGALPSSLMPTCPMTTRRWTTSTATT